MACITVENFTLPSTTGLSFQFSTSPRPLVIYFYPQDNTPGCTQEAIDFRDLTPEFYAAGAVIVGISCNSLKSHESFKAKLALPFELLSDPDKVVCNQFGVIKMKNMYGKLVTGIDRSTFVIDRNGEIVREWRNVKVKGHAAEVLACIQAL